MENINIDYDGGKFSNDGFKFMKLDFGFNELATDIDNEDDDITYEIRQALNALQFLNNKQSLNSIAIATMSDEGKVITFALGDEIEVLGLIEYLKKRIMD